MENQRIWELAGKKLAGEATLQELEELEHLLAGIPEKQRNLEGLQYYWSLPAAKPADAVMQQALEKHRRRLQQHMAQKEIQVKRMNYRRWLTAAAAAVLMLIFSTGVIRWYLQSRQPVMSVVATLNGVTKKCQLPDGTTVWLNAGSKITYATAFKQKGVREIFLTGEAYFNVIHDAARPFIIHTPELDIYDIGTAFNVKAYPQDKTTEATLIEGAIAIKLKNQETGSILLRPSEKITVYKAGTDIPVNNQPVNAGSIDNNSTNKNFKITALTPPAPDSTLQETAWMVNKLVFNSETFENLAKNMERRYNVTILFADEDIKQYRFTGTFINETTEEALKELQMIRPFNFTATGRNQIRISK